MNDSTLAAIDEEAAAREHTTGADPIAAGIRELVRAARLARALDPCFVAQCGTGPLGRLLRILRGESCQG